MTIFNAGDVTAEKTGALLNIALGELLGFANLPKSLSDLHVSPPDLSQQMG